MWKQEPVSHTKFCFKGMCSQDTSLSINSPLVFPKQMSLWYGTLDQGSKFLGPNPGAGSDHRCALGRMMKTCWDPTSSAFKGPGWLVRETQVQVHLPPLPSHVTLDRTLKLLKPDVSSGNLRWAYLTGLPESWNVTRTWGLSTDSLITANKSELLYSLIKVSYYYSLVFSLPEPKSFGEKQCFRHLKPNEN